MTETDLAEIETRTNAATEGPWTIQRLPDDTYWLRDTEGFVVNADMSKDDADFIAHARLDVPTLIAEVRRLRGKIEAACAVPQS